MVKTYGFSIGKERALKYMNIMGIHAIYPHRKKLTRIKDTEDRIYPYLLKEYRTLGADKTKSVYAPKPNEVWSGDITYIRMNGGFTYLAAVIDWHTRAILSYKISNIAIERFFRTLKYGNIYISDYSCVSELKEGGKKIYLQIQL